MVAPAVFPPGGGAPPPPDDPDPLGFGFEAGVCDDEPEGGLDGLGFGGFDDGPGGLVDPDADAALVDDRCVPAGTVARCFGFTEAAAGATAGVAGADVNGTVDRLGVFAGEGVGMRVGGA